jgi:hypothetical protein
MFYGNSPIFFLWCLQMRAPEELGYFHAIIDLFLIARAGFRIAEGSEESTEWIASHHLPIAVTGQEF